MQIAHLGLRPHAERLVTTAWDLGSTPLFHSLELREHAHLFGYGGQFATKSPTYSTTFSALRQARIDFARSTETDGPTLESDWRLAGMGYDDPFAERLALWFAEAEAELAAERSQRPRQPQSEHRSDGKA